MAIITNKIIRHGLKKCIINMRIYHPPAWPPFDIKALKRRGIIKNASKLYLSLINMLITTKATEITTKTKFKLSPILLVPFLG